MDQDQILDAASCVFQDAAVESSCFTAALDRLGNVISTWCEQGPSAVRSAPFLEVLSVEPPVPWSQLKLQETDEQMEQLLQQLDQFDPEQRPSVESSRRYFTEARLMFLNVRGLMQKFSSFASDVEQKLVPRVPAELVQLIPTVNFKALESYKAELEMVIAKLDLEIMLLDFSPEV